jgi:hypothetical protein
MKQAIIIIGTIAISMAAPGQMISMNMDGDDPALWERVFLDGDVSSHWSYDSDLTDLDSIVEHGIDPEQAVEALGISWVQLTNDSLSVVWKTRKIMRRYFYVEFDVDSVSYGAPSPIFGYEQTTFHLSGNDNWTSNATATLLHNKKWYRLYIRDDEAVYYFKGRI